MRRRNKTARAHGVRFLASEDDSSHVTDPFSRHLLLLEPFGHDLVVQRLLHSSRKRPSATSWYSKSSWLGRENPLAITPPPPHAASVQFPSLGTEVLDGPRGDLPAVFVDPQEDFLLPPIANRNS
ncbi:unnamed protein product [Phytophthora lilii]|uniref:Unnamed protein product n=1 Tax=Phytophthora lilii TaxID=2077276 RepID=A0A9W7CPS0_9STRA|nr:unnamed protein product [Phytophthora lilii]